jgi:hypothetical protein
VEAYEDPENEDLYLTEQIDALIKQIDVAYVARETRLVLEHLRDKDIAFFAASAGSFLQWKNRMRRKNPNLSPEATGVPALIRYLLKAPASTNFKNYRDHVKALEKLRAHATRFLKKHPEDQHYAQMRQDLATQIPLLAAQLRESLPSLLNQAIAAPWSPEEKLSIIEDIELLFANHWKDPEILWTGWRKILRENGNPVSGVYHEKGRNLNEDVLGTVEKTVDDWAERMIESMEEFAQKLYQSILDMLSLTRTNLNICTSTPELKDAAVEALDGMSEDMQATYDTFLDNLKGVLDENHLRFTTEMDIECPIAQIMKPSYERALDTRFATGGRGVYNRQRKVLKTPMLKPKKHYFKLNKKEKRIEPLLDTLKDKIMTRRRELWHETCTEFIDDAIAHLDEFSQTTKDLLMDANFMSESHQKARAELQKLLVAFDDSLEEVQDEFNDLEPQPPAKKVKIEVTEKAAYTELRYA